MLRVFHAGSWPAVGGEVTLSAEESSHLIRVRRARVGEPVEVLNGTGRVGQGAVSSADDRFARIKIEKIVEHPRPPGRTLAVGLPKGDVITEIVRQAVELGAAAVQPLLTDRTEVNWAADRAGHKLERWRAAALEAAKQSGNPWLPEIHAPVELSVWLKNLPEKSNRLVAALTADAQPVARSLEPGAEGEKTNVAGGKLPAPRSPLPAFLVVGPEGDFSPAEYAAFQTAGFQFIRLPGHVLRVETACVVGLASLQA